MPSTYTLNNGIELIATGEQSGTWGDTTNTNLELLDTALDGQVTVTLASAGTSGSPNTLPISDGAASNGRNRMVIFNDSSDLGATAYVQLTPNDAEKIIYVRNSLSGSRSILLFQGTYSASNDYEVPAGTTAVIFFDGAGSGAVAANVLSDLQVENLSVFGTAPTITLTDTDTGVDTELNAASSVGQFTLNIDKNNEGSSPRLVTQISGTEFFRINESGAVFNESSNDQDFRVESNGNTHALFVDAGAESIGMGTTSSPVAEAATEGLYYTIGGSLTVASNTETFQINRNSTGGNNRVNIGLYNNGTKRGEIGTYGSEDGMYFYAGSTVDSLRLTSGETVLNEGGADINFRVESDNNENMLFVDAGNDRIGIGTSSPGRLLTLFEDDQPVFQITNNTSGNLNTRGLIQYMASGTTDAVFDNQGSGSGGMFRFLQGGTERLRMTTSSFVANESGADYDFRVEGNAQAYAFFVDASTGGIRSDVYDFTINNQDDGPALTLMSGRDYNSFLMGAAENYGSNNSADNKWSWNWRGRNASSTGHYNFLYDEIGSEEYFRVQADALQKAVVVNEGGVDHDFRVETTNYNDMLFVDASTDAVGIGAGTTLPTTTTTWRHLFVGGNLAFMSNTTANEDVYMFSNMYYNGAFTVRNDGKVAYLRMDDGILYFASSDATQSAGATASFNNYLTISPGNVTIFNNDGLDQDFRVESDNNANMLVVDAGNDRVGIGCSPASTLMVDVDGAANAGGGDYWDLNKWFVISDGSTNSSSGLGITHTSAGGTYISSIHPYTAWRDLKFQGDQFQFLNGGTNNILQFDNSNFIVNENSLSVDFRVESDGNSQALWVDASEDVVKIGGSGELNPSMVLQIMGAMGLMKSFTVNSTASRIAEGTGGLFICRDDSYGGVALVLYEFSSTPTIIAQTGSNFTTSTPTGTQVQFTAAGSPAPFGMNAVMASGQSTTLRGGAIICDPS